MRVLDSSAIVEDTTIDFLTTRLQFAGMHIAFAERPGCIRQGLLLTGLIQNLLSESCHVSAISQPA
jgi:hypothetical protein